ncbi:hypothetical protein GCM10009558_079790 [Virgisporangium aurantiacum]
MTMTNEKKQAGGEPTGGDLVEELKSSGQLDALFAQIDAGNVQLTGDGGFVPALVKAALERGLQAELTSHLGYDKHAAEGRGSGNSRNGTTPKTVESEVGPIELDVPRDRAGSFTPRLVPKGQRRLGGLDDMIISLYAGGMTIRDIQHHLASTIGTDLSHETISNITDAVSEEVLAWQTRPLEEFYPVIYLDAIRIKIRENNQVLNRAAYIAVGVDLDGIKQVNDTFGHDAGDQVLIAFAGVLRASVREGDLVARLGGDEFAVLLESVDDVAAATAVADRILAALQEPVLVAGAERHLRTSIGVALSSFPDGAGAVAERDLLHSADVAMYVAKRRRSHGWQVYVEGSMELGRELAVLGEELGQAVTAGEMRVAYQPIVALSSGDLAGVEALARWHHPTRGIVPPATFIPLAEETGHIHEIGSWVLEQALVQVKQWQDRLPPERGMYLSVNVSALQLERPAFADEVIELIERVGYNPARLVLEVTESALVNEAAALSHLTELRKRGIRVAIDDFGTGYSSLRYLSRLPVDILKIDRSFVAELNGDPAGAAVAEAVIRLGQILQLHTVAEGIEQPAQATELTMLGCDNAQGYHFAEPLAVDAMDALVNRASAEWPSLPEAPARVSSA